jgi:hypothetical protein
LHHVLTLPYRGAEQTVAVIRREALRDQSDYAVRQLAEKISGGLLSKGYRDEYLAIYFFVLAHTRYMRDPRTVELVRSPRVMAREILAGKRPSVDCDDMAALICALVLAVGGQCRVVTVAFRNMFYKRRRQYSHVFAQAYDPRTSEWITLDPVAANKSRKMLNRSVAAKVFPVA